MEFCEDIAVPQTEKYHGKLSLVGHVAGLRVNHTGEVGLESSVRNTIMQTDKYLYQPGQTVQFRMLTIQDSRLTVSTEPVSGFSFSLARITILVLIIDRLLEKTCKDIVRILYY